MKKAFLLLAICAMTFSGFNSCRETKEKTVVVEKEVEEVEDKGAFERAAEKVDKEVNEKIDEEIEKIGDDN